MRLLSIDPSFNHIGWAMFDTDGKDFDNLNDWSFNLICPSAHRSRAEVLTYVKSQFSKANADHLICEMPAFFDSEKGRIAVKEGYTLNLSLVIGTIYGVIPNVELFLYTPAQWKGSVSKKVTQAKFKRVFKLGHVTLRHDMIDAIMLLRHHIETHFQLTHH